MSQSQSLAFIHCFLCRIGPSLMPGSLALDYRRMEAMIFTQKLLPLQ